MRYARAFVFGIFGTEVRLGTATDKPFICRVLSITAVGPDLEDIVCAIDAAGGKGLVFAIKTHSTSPDSLFKFSYPTPDYKDITLRGAIDGPPSSSFNFASNLGGMVFFNATGISSKVEAYTVVRFGAPAIGFPFTCSGAHIYDSIYASMVSCKADYAPPRPGGYQLFVSWSAWSALTCTQLQVFNGDPDFSGTDLLSFPNGVRFVITVLIRCVALGDRSPRLPV